MDKLKDGYSNFESALADVDILNRLQDEIAKKVPVTIPKTLIVTSTALVTFAIMYFALGPAHVTNFLGFAFPAYASFKAIESPEKDDDTQWLTYWVVFSGFSLLETFSDVLAESFPMYFAFKFAFLIWLSAPMTRGAEFLYANFVRPFLLENEKTIDRKLAQAEEAATEVAGATQEIAHEKAEEIIEEVKEMAAQDGYENVEQSDAQ